MISTPPAEDLRLTCHDLALLASAPNLRDVTNSQRHARHRCVPSYRAGKVPSVLTGRPNADHPNLANTGDESHWRNGNKPMVGQHFN